MIRYTAKMERSIVEAQREGYEQGYKEGLEAGIAKGRAGREEAEAKGEPFTDLPPPNPENGTGK
jgi:flagellar biosynthesis/type III secretory pathway protein FliH